MAGVDVHVVLTTLENLGGWRMRDDRAWWEVGTALDELRVAVDRDDRDALRAAHRALAFLTPGGARAEPGPAGIPPHLRAQRDLLLNDLAALAAEEAAGDVRHGDSGR
ncbi:CATRA system-associated protein [Streptomyces sp. HPF1205]|uniref:CATRA system-associated protein n=1 Tax=Streptomyces sp. HPF1205 TaxID=2873262 RepID=UPI001CED28A5|nr:CATRA system-associated protein [Streptomyces sp. HPF1205]